MERRHHETQTKQARRPAAETTCSRPIPSPGKEVKERLAVERMLSEGCPNTQPIGQNGGTGTLNSACRPTEAPAEPRVDRPHVSA
jgi:hypothetical protein